MQKRMTIIWKSFEQNKTIMRQWHAVPRLWLKVEALLCMKANHEFVLMIVFFSSHSRLCLTENERQMFLIVFLSQSLCLKAGRNANFCSSLFYITWRSVPFYYPSIVPALIVDKFSGYSFVITLGLVVFNKHQMWYHFNCILINKDCLSIWE